MHFLSPCRVGVSVLVALAVSTAQAVPLTGGFNAIAVRNNVGTNTERTAGEGDGSPSRAIDGNLLTATYLTTSNTSTTFSPQHVYLDLNLPTAVYGLRWSKTDGYVDPHNLAIFATIGGGALIGRTYSPVTNMVNGYQGTELVNGSFSGNTITGENDGSGFYSVSFDGVAATAIRFDFSSAPPFDHYHVNEFQAIVPEPASLGLILAAIPLVRRRR